MTTTRHLTLPGGFTAAGVACGIKPSGRNDLAILAAEKDIPAAIVTTSNQIVGAPILYDRDILPRGYGRMRGMVVNAGNSNVCTGKAGLADAHTMARLTARHLDTTAERILVASTGVIGHRLPMAKVRAGIAAAAEALSTRNDAAALQAIMTTDTREKSAVVQLTLAGKAVTLAGVIKGAGMIAPSLATMIALITTDATIAPSALHRLLKATCQKTFNAATIDNDQSTSDIVAAFASGQADTPSFRPGTRDAKRFAAALDELCGELARAMARDGEGATRLIEINVGRARSDRQAEQAAKTVANSLLVKTAIHGCDPNWGRIAMALGNSPAEVRPDRLTITLNGTRVFTRGKPASFDDAKLSASMKQAQTITIDCDLGLARGSYTAWTCDLSRDYIAINADYTT
jgi:glutamate N-acetyltransferase / amino-acid N-acetyltransferase